MTNGRNGSHWDGCWRAHLDCAVKEIERLQAELERLRAVVDRLQPPPGQCEHGVIEGDWCEPCNRAYKEAAKAAEKPPEGIDKT